MFSYGSLTLGDTTSAHAERNSHGQRTFVVGVVREIADIVDVIN